MTTDEHGEGVLDSGGRRLDQIRLTGITAVGYHGVFEFERREGQTFVADVVVHLDTRRAAARDDLAHTLDYGALAKQVSAVLSGEPVDLIETVAERIAATVLASGLVQAVDVQVHKPQAPIEVPFGDVVVAIHRNRSKLPAAEPYLPRPMPDEAPPAARHRPAPTASFPVTPPPGIPAPAAVPPPAPVLVAGVLGSPVPAAVSGAAAAAPIPWSDIVQPLGPEPAAAAPASAPTPTSAPATHGAEMDAGSAARSATGPAFMAAPIPMMPSPWADGSGNGPLIGAAAPEDVVAGEIVLDALDVAPESAVDIVLALGANLGASQDTLRDAVGELAGTAGIEVVQVSPLARTAAVGGPEQPDYLNAVVLARTVLSPRDLLRATQAVEQMHGRERAEHWGPRTLDIDIVVYGSVLAVTDDLELPHPLASQRAFVLEPWAQVDPHAVLPGLGGGPVAALAATAPDRAGIRWLALDWLVAPPHAVPDDTAATPDANPAGDADTSGPSGPFDPFGPEAQHT